MRPHRSATHVGDDVRRCRRVRMASAVGANENCECASGKYTVARVAKIMIASIGHHADDGGVPLLMSSHESRLPRDFSRPIAAPWLLTPRPARCLTVR